MDYLYESKINYERSQGDNVNLDPTLERLLSALSATCALIAIADEMRKIRMIMEMKEETTMDITECLTDWLINDPDFMHELDQPAGNVKLSEFIKNYVVKNNPVETGNMYYDMLNIAIQSVDYNKIASFFGHYNEQ